MKTIKKVLSVVLVMAITAAIAIGGTLAYLTDRDSEANVFTVGNVSIELNEDFAHASALIPGVDIGKKPTITNTGKNDAWVWAEIAIPSALNNTASAAGNAVHFNMSAESVADGLWNWWDGADYSEGAYFIKHTQIDNVDYDVYTVQYETALKAGETTEQPVMHKVYLDPRVDIDPDGNWSFVSSGVVTPINWNSNTDGNPVIYVSAYAMQKENFETVYEAYDAYQVQWGTGNAGEQWADPIPAETKVIKTADEAYGVFSNLDQSGERAAVALAADYYTSDAQSHWSGNREYAIRRNTETQVATDVTIDLNDHIIHHDTVYQDGKSTGYTYLFTTAYNGKLTINGYGTIESANNEGNACIIYAQGPSEVVINGGEFRVDKGIAVWAGKDGKVTINDGSFISTGSAGDEELIYSSGGVIDIYGGFFHNKEWEERPVNVADANRGTGFINIYGGTFVNFDPSTGGNDPANIKVMDGYKVVSETQDNGDVWYTVVPE